MLRSKQQEAAVLLMEQSAERKAIEALSDVKKTADKMVQKAKGLHKDAEMLLSDAKSDADWDLIDEQVEGLKIEIKELEDKVKLSEKTLTAAEKLAHAANMTHRSNAIYSALKPYASKSKSGPKLEPFSEQSPSRRPLPPQPKIFGGKSKRRRLSSKKQTKRNRRN